MEVIEFTGSLEFLRPVMEQWLVEADLKHYGIDFKWPKVFVDFQKLINEENSCLLVLLSKQRPIGFMGLNVFESPLGDQKMVNEHYWYVESKSRGFGGMRLLREAIKWTRERNCTHLIMNASMMAGSLHDRVCKIYEKNGMTKFETSYIREV